MPTYRFQAFDRSGSQVHGDVVAVTEPEALEQLAGRGLSVFELRSAGAPAAQPWHQREILVRKTHLSGQELGELARALGLMLRTGIPLTQALSIAAESLSTDRLRRLSRRLEAALLRGESLSRALADGQGVVPFELLAFVRAGEAANRLGEAFQEASIFYERRSGLRAKALAALAYPAFLIVAAFVVLLIVIFVLTPTLFETFESSGVPVSGLIAGLEALRIWLLSYGTIVLGLLGAGVLALLVTGGRLWRGVSGLVPFLRRLGALGEYGRTARMLRTLLVSGEKLEAAFDATSTLSGDPACRTTLAEAKALILAGKPAGPLFLETTSVPRLFARLYDLGERTDNLPDLLLVASDQLQAEHGRALDRLTGLITPLLTLVVGGVIATLVFVMLSAVLEVSQIAI